MPVRTYVVEPGDSPALIAARFAGCPKCAIDLVTANPHKPSVQHPNGFLSFRSMSVGERLTLPDKWFSEEFESLPSSYFSALPYPDGVSGALGNYSSLDRAGLSVSALASKDDRSFADSVNGVAAEIDASVVEAYGGGNVTSSALADTVHTATNAARSRNESLKSALSSGDDASIPRLRLDVQNALTTALGAARITLEAFYASKSPVPQPPPASAPRPAPVPVPTPAPVAVAPVRGVTAGTVAGSLIGIAIVGGAIYWAVTKPPRVRRVRDTSEEDRSDDR